MMDSPPKTENDENRRISRFTMALPVKVESIVNSQTSWSEVTRLQDISNYGAGFNLKRPVKSGRLIKLTMPLPRQLRNYDFGDPQYLVWALVRRSLKIETTEKADLYAHGVAFIGKNPPESFVENPSKIYELTTKVNGIWSITEADTTKNDDDLPPDKRRHSRLSIPLTLQAEKIDGDGNKIATEYAVTENLSVSGAAVISTIDVNVGEFLRITSDQYRTTIISIVRGKRIGADGIPRLHLEFIDSHFPLEEIG